MSRPRNVIAYARGRENLEAIRQLMVAHVRANPLRRHLTGLQIQAHLPHLALSSILRYVKMIHDQAEREAVRDPVLESF